MTKQLTDKELETYSRQIVLSDIGYDGQLKLRNSKACLIGVGGLGSPIATQLVGMGIGYLRIVDRDIVSRSDLHRQHLYDLESVGMPKKVFEIYRALLVDNLGLPPDILPQK
jgi:adenylyltransferase/sulfurtransferase